MSERIEYTTKSGRLKIWEANNGFYVEELATGRIKGCGDGAQWQADDDESLDAANKREACRQRMVDDIESSEAEWLTAYFPSDVDNMVQNTYMAGVNRDSDREIDGALLAQDKPHFNGTDTALVDEVKRTSKVDFEVSLSYAEAQKLAHKLKSELKLHIGAGVKAKGIVFLRLYTTNDAVENMGRVAAALKEEGV